MPCWRVDFKGKVLMTLGSVEAPDEASAIAQAAELYNIRPARQNKIVVKRLEIKEADKKR
jgi:1,2-phenylacetyl-CoA epoxidase PaaB subunit